MKLCYAYVTCSKKEADGLMQALLDSKQVACIKQLPVRSAYWWGGAIEKANETMLILETAEHRLTNIEELLHKIHSYDTFMLTAVPMGYVSTAAREWMEETMR